MGFPTWDRPIPIHNVQNGGGGGGAYESATPIYRPSCSLPIEWIGQTKVVPKSKKRNPGGGAKSCQKAKSGTQEVGCLHLEFLCGQILANRSGTVWAWVLVSALTCGCVGFRRLETKPLVCRVYPRKHHPLPGKHHQLWGTPCFFESHETRRPAKSFKSELCAGPKDRKKKKKKKKKKTCRYPTSVQGKSNESGNVKKPSKAGKKEGILWMDEIHFAPL